MDKIYTHPEIILRIIETLESNSHELEDIEKLEIAKIEGGREAEEMMKNLFPKRQEYGTIQSHFNTQKLSSERYKNFQERIVNIYFQRKTIVTELNAQMRNFSLKTQELDKVKSSIFHFFFK